MTIFNTVFPPEVCRELQRAANAPEPGRHVEIDRVIEWARVKYPEFFRPEVHDEAGGSERRRAPGG